MVWLHPAALVGLVSVAGPILVHLLRRQRARRVVVPSVRFVRAAGHASARPHRPSDPWLLAIRAAVVACAAIALAGPLRLTEARTAGWSARTARVVLVDASDSARPLIDRAQAEAELSAAGPGTLLDTSDLRAGLRRATAWLAQSPPARREIVVLSDFQIGALSPADLAQVPGDIGIRLLPVRAAPAERGAAVPGIIDRDRRLDGRLALDPERTTVTYRIVPGRMDGLRIQAPAAEAGSVASLLRVVRRAGAVAPSPEQPIVIRFPGAPSNDAAASSAGGWTTRAADRLLRSREIEGIDVQVSSANGALVVDVDADPASLEAALVVKAALDARHDLKMLAEREPRRADESTLAGWSRPPGPADAAAWRQTDESDGRWFWALALMLLAVEGIVRRSGPPEEVARERHAA